MLQPGTVTPVVQVKAPRPARRGERLLDGHEERARVPASLEDDLGQDLVQAQQLLQETRRALARR